VVGSTWPDCTNSLYKLITVLEWPERESFEKGFYDSQVQANLRCNVEMLSDPVHLISEILVEGADK
jgi:hypothetical protein